MEEMIITPAGKIKLEKELKELTELKRPEIIKRIAAAKELGDLSENADYHGAREEQSFIEGRIAEVEEILKKSVVVNGKTGKNGEVGIGSSVKLQNGKLTTSYYITGSNESDPIAKKISNESPLGRALLGRKVGDMVEITTPAGKKVEYKILAIK